MIKNEQEVIEKFLNHHIDIVDNITLIDNGSLDNTISIVKKFDVDLHIRNDHFSFKSNIFSEFISQSKYDIIIPMDADEILVFDDSLNISINQSIIKKYLTSLLHNRYSLYKINKIYNYVPDTENSFCVEKDRWRSKKFFFRTNDFISSCPGFHDIKTTNNKYMETSISYLHYHYLNFNYWFNSAAQKMQARLGKDWNNIEALKTYKGFSNHIAKQLLEYFLTNKWHNLQHDIYI